MRSTPRIILLACLLIIALHCWGMLLPSHYNWGVHFLALYNPVFGVILLLVSLSLFIEPIRRNLIRLCENGVQTFSRLPKWAGVLIVSAVLVAAALMFPDRGSLLGDTRLILLTLTGISSESELASHYRNQPFFFLALEYARNLAGADPRTTLAAAYKILDLVALVIFVGIVFAFVGDLDTSPVVKFFAGVLLLAGAGSQLFFGYIENYAPGYALTAAYVTTGGLALQRKVNIIIPLLCFMLIAGLHTGALVFVPSVIILLYFAWWEKRRAAMIIGALVVAVLLLVESSSHNDLYQFGLRIFSVMKNDFLPLVSTTPDIPYTIFSWVHFIDWMNLHLLVVPFGLLISVVVLLFARHSIEFRNAAFLFLLTTTLCGLFFTFVIASTIGLFRDWDLMAGFLIPLMFLTVYLICHTLQKAESKKIIFIMAIVTVIHTASWIGVNANNERHLQRAEILTQALFMGRFAQLLYYEQLANAFWDRKDYAHAKIWYERYVTLDSSNPRLLGNLADVYKRLGENKKYFEMLKRLADNNTPNPAVYSNLGLEYFHRGDTTASIAMFERALEIDSTLGIAHGNLAFMYLQMKHYDLALRHSTMALASGMTEPLLYKCAGLALAFQGEFKRALPYLDVYLSRSPDDQYVRAMRERLNTLLTRL